MLLYAKRIREIAVLLALAAALQGQNTGQTVRHHKVAVDAPNSDLSQIESLIEQKDYAAAEAALRTVTAEDPTNYNAWFDLGFVYNALGRDDDSTAAYRKSVAAKPDVFESNLNLGLMLVRAGKAEAADYLRAATKLTPTGGNPDEGRARAWLSLGHVLESSNPEQALEAYRQAAALQPKDPEPLISAGALLQSANRFADAEQSFKQALGLDPNNADTITALANLYMRGHKFTEAEALLKQLVALHPQDAGAHLQLGRMLAASEDNDGAIAEMQAALKLAPNDPAAVQDLADVYVKAGNFNEAALLYQKLVNADPRNAPLHAAFGHVLLKARNFTVAQEQLLMAVDLKPDLGTAYGDLAIAANENKNYPLAIKALDSRAQYLPELPVGYFLRATAYDHLHDPKLAAENYHKFLELAAGQYPDQEWQARHRLIALEPKNK